MNYEAIEGQIRDKLTSDAGLTAIADITILPDDVADYKMPVVKGLVTVVFMGEKADADQSIGDLSQHTILTFNISIQSRLLRGANGAYAISERIKTLLIGFTPADCDRLNLSSHDFNGYQNEVWEHSVTFSCRSLRTQDEHLPLSDEIITNDGVYYQTASTNENLHI